MNTAADTSGWPTLEIALLIAEAMPARSTGTEAMSVVVSGATISAIPTPKTVTASTGPSRVASGGTRDAGSEIDACQAGEVDGTRIQITALRAMSSGPTTRNGRAPMRLATCPTRADAPISRIEIGMPTIADASGV